MSDRANTTDKLRKDIDGGTTGDKVPFEDPTAAPLGTDDEAAGSPPSPQQVSEARRLETGPQSHQAPAVTEERSRGDLASSAPRGMRLILLLFLTIAEVVLAWALVGQS